MLFSESTSMALSWVSAAVGLLVFPHAEFTLPRAPGDSSSGYLVIIPVHWHEHGEKGDRFTWWMDCRAHGSGKKPVGSRWGCCCDLLLVDSPYSAETRPAPCLPALCPTGFLSTSAGQEDRACQNQGSVFNVIVTAVKVVNRQNQGKEEDFSGASLGRGDQLYTSFYHPRKLQEPTCFRLGAHPAETWCPNQGLCHPRCRVWGGGLTLETVNVWPQAQGLETVGLTPFTWVQILYSETPYLFFPSVCLAASGISNIWMEGVTLINLWSFFFSSSCRIYKRSGTFEWVAALCSAEWRPLVVSY